jgi:hypothetical protein
MWRVFPASHCRSGKTPGYAEVRKEDVYVGGRWNYGFAGIVEEFVTVPRDIFTATNLMVVGSSWQGERDRTMPATLRKWI